MEKRIYVLFDSIKDELIMASFDKKEALAKIGEDFVRDIDIRSYRLKSGFLDDLDDMDD